MPRRMRDTLKGSAWPALFCLALLAGCRGCRAGDADAYPETLAYPPRADWVVDQLPTTFADEPEKVADMEAPIRRINALGGRAYDPATVPADLRAELQAALADLFGTPAAPTVKADGHAPFSAERLLAGSQLYRRHCLQCHGLTGDGRGPTAMAISPYPRDYRQGVFKFVSTNGTAARKPTRADLGKVIANGIPTTAMPPFNLIPEEDRDRLTDYVQYLSLRGKAEYDLLRTLAKGGEAALEESVPADAAAVLEKELKAWAAAQTDVMPIFAPEMADDSPEMAASIRRGRDLFLDAKGAGCVACHGDYGRKGKPQDNVWGFRVVPADLTDHKRKGGTGREDIYRRVRGGIGPSNMPAAATLTEQQTWDVVHFVRALPNPSLLPADVKRAVYGE